MASDDAPIDINIPRKGRLIDDDFDETRGVRLPLFSLIEFNLSGLCNRTCVFCPRVDPAIFPNRNEHIPLELYEKIMRELAELSYTGMINYAGFGEPLLTKRLDVLITMTKRHCPSARLEMVTNGDSATAERLRALFDAGLDTLLVSMYDGPEQLPHFERMREEAGLTNEQLLLRVRWLPAEQHFGIALSNRGGSVEIREAGVTRLSEPLKRRCHYPFYMVMVDYDGSLLLCPHDWGKKLVIGNLNQDRIVDLWDGDAMQQVRKRLAAADRDFAPCDVCDVDGTLMGARHFQAWRRHYDLRERAASP